MTDPTTPPVPAPVMDQAALRAELVKVTEQRDYWHYELRCADARIAELGRQVRESKSATLPAPVDQAAIVRACAALVGDTYSGEWAADAVATLEADADRIERGEPCSLLLIATGLSTTATDQAAALREAAAAVAALDRREIGITADTIRDAREEDRDEGADLLRRMADETAATETAALNPAERTMLTYALDQAQERIWSEDGFTHEDQAAVDSLRRLTVEQPAAGARQDGAQR
ncbi:hypothetical protein [Streptomyces sp. SID8352]|uniref:hypothetical protein n=1 Tax=Streptomyces sp. SID8352 TaxID=2690338 RepID=UPI00139D4258|nr:hypothetical protein [Streptomyces sp. SID8352]MYU20781.1 hypothetical protein [Streptomyces sp. SID8352]